MSIKTKISLFLAFACLSVNQVYAVAPGLYLGIAVGMTKTEGREQTVYTSPFNLPLIVTPGGLITDNNQNPLPFGSYTSAAYPYRYQVIIPPPHAGLNKTYIFLPKSPVVVSPTGNPSSPNIATNSNGKLPSGQYDFILGTPVRPKTATGTGERIFIGMHFNDYGGMELGYTHYAPIDYKVPAGTVSPAKTPAIRTNVVDLVGVVSYPISKIAIFAKIGVAGLYLTESGSLTPPAKTGSSSTTKGIAKPILGAGVSYDLTQSWVLDFSYTRILGGGSVMDTSFAGVGISYHFVDKLCGQFLCSSEGT